MRIIIIVIIIIVVVVTVIFTSGEYSLQANFASLRCKSQSTEEKRHNSCQSTYFIWELCGDVKLVDLQKGLSLLERPYQD